MLQPITSSLSSAVSEISLTVRLPHNHPMVLLDHGGRDAEEYDILAPPTDLSGVVQHVWVKHRMDVCVPWRCATRDLDPRHVEDRPPALESSPVRSQ